MSNDIATREYEDISISLPWGQLAGRWYGQRSLRPILAIHGWLDNIGTWDTLIPLLPQHIGILCFDLPGHGRSSKYPQGVPYDVSDYMKLIIHILKEYKWQKISLMGHSLGAVIAFAYASIYPHTVDMIIAIDIVQPPYYPPAMQIEYLRTNAEKMIIEVERIDKLDMHEPPAYTYDQLKQLLYEGSQRSVDMDKCHHLLERNITKSQKYPDKYYFSRDGRTKYYNRFLIAPELSQEMAKRIKNVPHLVIKGSRSFYINEISIPIIQFLRENNPHFEFHEIEGTHHVHLNNAAECAAVINPFINAHRPAMPNIWSIDGDEDGAALGVGKSRSSARGIAGKAGATRWRKRSKL